MVSDEASWSKLLVLKGWHSKKAIALLITGLGASADLICSKFVEARLVLRLELKELLFES